MESIYFFQLLEFELVTLKNDFFFPDDQFIYFFKTKVWYSILFAGPSQIGVNSLRLFRSLDI